jgi:hypothetical protein
MGRKQRLKKVNVQVTFLLLVGYRTRALATICLLEPAGACGNLLEPEALWI